MTYIVRPTEVLCEFLVLAKGQKLGDEFYMGRLAMALEILTVIKTLEDRLVPMMALDREETISVLTTLLRDQDLTELADEWYERLNRWRQPSFEPEPEPARTGAVVDQSLRPRAVPPSRLEALREAVALRESTDVQPGNDQSQALPSGESEELQTSGDESTPSV